MTVAEKNKLEKLKWESERKSKQFQLAEKLKQVLNNDSFEFMSFEESDKIQLFTDDWPENKWNDLLYVQTEIQNKLPIDKIVTKYTALNKNDFIFIFFFNFNFGLVKILNSTLRSFWADFIEIDGDQIFCYQQNETNFICIEKTEDVIVGDQNRQYIYEITFSNQNIKSKVV